MEDTLNIKQAVEKATDLLKDRLVERFNDQGHGLTGESERGLKTVVALEGGQYIGRVYGADHFLYLEFGVKPERIPYTRGEGRGGTSAYIQGLIRFWEKRGLQDREAIGAAFATAAIHKRDGMPTRKSLTYSNTGKRTGFIAQTIRDSEEEVRALVERSIGGLALELFIAPTQFTTLEVEIG